MDKEFAEEFLSDWLESWNAHNLERILAHYTDDFEMNSPVIAQRMGVPSGKLRGKSAIGEYWGAALKAYPDLRFELQAVYVGMNSITVQYHSSVSGNVCETFIFGESPKAEVAYAMYE